MAMMQPGRLLPIALPPTLQALSPATKDDAVQLIDPTDQAKLPECVKFLQDFVRDKVK